jgi:hypothetical protein
MAGAGPHVDGARAARTASSVLAGASGRWQTGSPMDADDDPLTRLAQELERLSQAHLALGEATARLIREAPPAHRRVLGEAASASRSAARTASAASARALAALDDGPSAA